MAKSVKLLILIHAQSSKHNTVVSPVNLMQLPPD